MNKQTLFHVKLIAKKQALESIIEDTINHINDERHPATKAFFVNSLVRYEAKLETVNQIIEEYLNS